MYGKTNVGGGSGGFITSNDALLAVTSGINTTVSLTKNGVTKQPVNLVKASDQTKKVYIYTFRSGELDSSNPWVMTSNDGTSTITKNITINSNRIYEENAFSRLPYQYTELTYIKSTSSGINYFNTNISAKDIGQMQIYGRMLSVSSTYASASLFGATGATNSIETQAFAYRPKDGVFFLGTNNNTSGDPTPLSTGSDFGFYVEYDPTYAHIFKITTSSGTYGSTMTTTKTYSISATSAASIANRALYLFANNYAGSTLSGSSVYAQIYMCRIRKRRVSAGTDGDLVRDLVPCQNNSTNPVTYGFYDLVSKSFIAASGSFEGGNAVI